MKYFAFYKDAVNRWSKVCKFSTLPEIPECKHVPSAYHVSFLFLIKKIL